MRGLFWKEYDLLSCEGDMWENPNKAEDIEPLNSHEFFASGRALTSLRESSLTHSLVVTSPTRRVSAFPPMSEGINTALPKETVMASPEAWVLQDNSDSSQDQPPALLFASSSISTFRSQ